MIDKDLLRRNWLGILGLVVGVLGIALSYFFYVLSQQSREPVLVEVNNISIFSSPEGLVSDKFAVVTKPGFNEITNNVYVNEVAFWNRGRQSIKQGDILKNIYFEYPDDVKVIDAFVTSSTRPDIVKVKVDYKTSENKVYISFDILEKGDGFRVQIVYSSTDKSSPEIKGNIEGVTQFYSSSDLTNKAIFVGIAKFIFGVFVLLCGIFMIAAIGEGFERLSKRYFPGKIIIIKKVSDNGIWLLTIFVIFVFSFAVIKNIAEKEEKGSVPKMEKILNK